MTNTLTTTLAISAFVGYYVFQVDCCWYCAIGLLTSMKSSCYTFFPMNFNTNFVFLHLNMKLQCILVDRVWLITTWLLSEPGIRIYAFFDK